MRHDRYGSVLPRDWATRAAALLVTLLVGFVSAAWSASGEGLMTSSAAREAVEAAIPSIEKLRGLEFEEPVSVEVVDDAVLRRHTVKRMDRFYSESVIHAQQRAYIQLGLLPEGTDILEQYLRVMEEQAGGFYDPSAKSFFLLDDMPAGLAPLLAAHELTHALEDQHFDLDARLEAALPNEDLAFATSAVHEGSAMLVMAAYLIEAMAEGTVDSEDLQALASTEAARGEKLAAMPAALSRPLLAAYILGMNFLSRGNPASIATGVPTDDLNRCYREGPVSSEQILHPDKFWDPSRRDDPTLVDPGDAGQVLGRHWKRTAHGVLGELVLGVLVGAPTPTDLVAMAGTGIDGWANEASSGWDGDRWELWTRGRSSVTLLQTIWDSSEDAVEFAAKLTPRPGFEWKVSGSRVAVVAGNAGGKTEALLEAMLAEPRDREHTGH